MVFGCDGMFNRIFLGRVDSILSAAHRTDTISESSPETLQIFIRRNDILRARFSNIVHNIYYITEIYCVKYKIEYQ